MITYVKYTAKEPGKPDAPAKWYARAVSAETMDTEALAAHMAAHSSPYTKGVVHGVLKDAIACIKELLLDGKKVKLDNLAIFSVGLQTVGAESAEAFRPARHITGVRMRARATGELLNSRIAELAVLREAAVYTGGAAAVLPPGEDGPDAPGSGDDAPEGTGGGGETPDGSGGGGGTGGEEDGPSFG